MSPNKQVQYKMITMDKALVNSLPRALNNFPALQTSFTDVLFSSTAMAIVGLLSPTWPPPFLLGLLLLLSL